VIVVQHQIQKKSAITWHALMRWWLSCPLCSRQTH